MKYLTENDVEKFNRDGFLFVKNLFSGDELKNAIKLINELSKNKPEDWENGKEMAYYETSRKNHDGRILSRIEKYVDYHKEFHNIAYSSKVILCVEDLLGEKSVLFKDKINFKRPGASGFRPHQDVQARWDDFVPYTLNVLISTDESNLENGCLEVAAGHHKRGLIGKYDAPLQGDDLKGMNFVPVPTSVGDVLFFDHFTPHQSKPNMSNRSRSNIYLTYNKISYGDHRFEYLNRKRKEFPPDNERDETFKDSPIHEALYKDRSKS